MLGKVWHPVQSYDVISGSGLAYKQTGIRDTVHCCGHNASFHTSLWALFRVPCVNVVDSGDTISIDNIGYTMLSFFELMLHSQQALLIMMCKLQILLPQLEALNADITVLSADTDAEKRKQEASSREVADLKEKLQQVRLWLCFGVVTIVYRCSS